MIRPLRRIKAGHYQTRDGKFTFLRDPTGGDHVKGWGFASWLVYDESEPDEGALVLLESMHQATLKEAVEALEHELEARKKRGA